MKIKVIKKFFDKENNKILRETGTQLEVSDERGNELISKGFAIEVKKTTKKTKEKTTEKAID